MKRAALAVTIVLLMVATFEYLMRRNAEGWCLRLGIAEARVGFDLQHGWRRYCPAGSRSHGAPARPGLGGDLGRQVNPTLECSQMRSSAKSQDRASDRLGP